MIEKYSKLLKRGVNITRKTATKLKSYSKLHLANIPTTIAPISPPILSGVQSIITATITLVTKVTKKIIAMIVKEAEPSSFSCMIKEKKKNAVHVGIFGERNTLIRDITIQSPEGLSADLTVGEVIYV